MTTWTLPARPQRPWPRGAWIALAWTGVGLVAVLFRAIALWRQSGAIDWTAVLHYVALIPAWALMTPGIFGAAHRWPVRGEARFRNVACHLALAGTFILVSNIAVRLPLLLTSPDGPAAMLDSLADGLVTFGPFGVIAWAFLLMLGHMLPPPPGSLALAAAPATSAAVDVASAPHATTGATRETPLVIRDADRTIVLRMEEIAWVEADDNYVRLGTDRGEFRSRERIADIAERLDAARFVRIHRSTIVAIDRVREVRALAHGDRAVVLADGRLARVARSRREALAQALASRLILNE